MKFLLKLAAEEIEAKIYSTKKFKDLKNDLILLQFLMKKGLFDARVDKANFEIAGSSNCRFEIAGLKSKPKTINRTIISQVFLNHLDLLLLCW